MHVEEVSQSVEGSTHVAPHASTGCVCCHYLKACVKIVRWKTSNDWQPKAGQRSEVYFVSDIAIVKHLCRDLVDRCATLSMDLTVSSILKTKSGLPNSAMGITAEEAPSSLVGVEGRPSCNVQPRAFVNETVEHKKRHAHRSTDSTIR